MKRNKLYAALIAALVVLGFGVVGLNEVRDGGLRPLTIGDRTEKAQDNGMNAGEHQTETEEKKEFSDDINIDILSRHLLPGFARMEEEDRNEYVESLQVMEKVRRLGLSENDFLYPELNLQNAEQKILGERWDYSGLKVVDFHGTTAGELQEAINNNRDTIINIVSEEIVLEEGIILKDNVCIYGNDVKITGNGVEFAFLGDGVKNVVIDSVRLSEGADYGVYLVNCTGVEVTNCEMQGLNQKPVCVVGGSKNIIIADNNFHHNMAGGIYFTGDCSFSIVENNSVCDNGGTSNWMAGIVLTNVTSADPMNIWETFDEFHHFPYKENLYSQTECPHEIIVRNNIVMNNNASGIYSDGAYKSYVINNTVKGNDKEGICLDYGTVGFYLTENLFDSNGKRGRQTDFDLQMDFVFGHGRMEDGSAKAKLPGVSLDNTVYNVFVNNIVSNNYGGGVKMVRTTARTLIMENIIKDNNNGRNDIFHFFGIELGSAVADVESTDMDFTPDFENIICRNTISGLHYSGIFVGENCYVNDIFDNVIMEPQMFAVEAISTKFNSIVNNLSNAGIRNECVQ